MTAFGFSRVSALASSMANILTPSQVPFVFWHIVGNPATGRCEKIDLDEI
jgi:hypothetical protein